MLCGVGVGCCFRGLPVQSLLAGESCSGSGPRRVRVVAGLPALLPWWCAGSRRRVLNLVAYDAASESVNMGSLGPGMVFSWFICYKYVRLKVITFDLILEYV